MSKPIEYDTVTDEKGVRIFGENPGAVYMWCLRSENRNRALKVKSSKTGETQSIEDYLYKVD